MCSGRLKLVRLAAALSLIVVLAAVALPAGDTKALSPTGTYVIVHTDTLAAAAQQWRAYREEQRWAVHLVNLNGVPHEESRRRQMIRDEIRRQYALRDAVDAPFMVLLLGDVGDERDARIPTWRFDQRDTSLQSHNDKTYITDHPYQLADDADDMADFALGRIPVTTHEQAMTVLAKIQRYESTPPHVSANHIAYVAGEGRFGPADALLEHLFQNMIDRMVPLAFDVSMLYAKPCSPYCPPPSTLTDCVLEQLSRGSLIFNYIGHGSARSFDRLRLGESRFETLSVESLSRLPDCRGQLPIAVLTCCDTGWFDLPGDQRSLAEAMLAHPEGPVAVIAGSRNTHPYANTLLQKNIARELFEKRTSTLGMAELHAINNFLTHDAIDVQLDRLARPLAQVGRWPSSLTTLRAMHTKLYNLFGDPAMLIQYPPAQFETFRIEGSSIVGSLSGMLTGEVVVTFQMPRAGCTRCDQLLECPGTTVDTAELERIAAHNFPLINDRVLRRIALPIVDGRFLGNMPDDLPSQAAIVSAVATGWDANGQRTLATFGSMLSAARQQQ